MYKKLSDELLQEKIEVHKVQNKDEKLADELAFTWTWMEMSVETSGFSTSLQEYLSVSAPSAGLLK